MINVLEGEKKSFNNNNFDRRKKFIVLTCDVGAQLHA
jgi:hypothetical protein